MEKELNWKKIDRQYKYYYYEDRLKTARLLGYKYVSECTARLYAGFKSTNKVAEILKVSPFTVQRELKAMGIKLRKRGGNTCGKDKRIGRHPWNPLATNTRSPMSRPQ